MEIKLSGRSQLAYNWLPEKSGKLLDAGCSFGYSTVFFAEKADETYGIDANKEHILSATKEFVNINFRYGFIEELPYEDSFFDSIVMMDVLEHTQDKIKSLSEIYRVLKPGGYFIFSTPHKGKFEYIDPYNYGFNFRKYLPFIYTPIYKFVRWLKTGKMPKESYNPEHLQRHEHYSESDYYQMLEQSSFKKKFKVKKVFKSGLFKEVLWMNAEIFLGIFVGIKKAKELVYPKQVKAAEDFFIEYGEKSYNIAMMIQKTD